MEEEIWKDVEGYSKYLISNTGNVKEMSTGRLMPQTINGGFWCTNLFKDCGRKELAKVHRLVAIAFLPNTNEAKKVGHKGDRLNNHYTNLEWRPKQTKVITLPIEYGGNYYSYKDFAGYCKISLTNLRIKLRTGWSLQECFTGHKEFKGKGFTYGGYWFPYKSQMEEFRKQEKSIARLLIEKIKEERRFAKKSHKICGVGINDISEPSTSPYYIRWAAMLQRGHSEKFKIKYPSYRDTYVSDEWLILSTFKQWMQSQAWEGLELDKDILMLGNKLYSNETCAFVPAFVNSSLCLSARNRGLCPLGVTFNKTERKFYAKIKDRGMVISLGYFTDTIQAHKAWQQAKVVQLENTITDYRAMDCFRTDVAEGLMTRIWKLRMEISKGSETTSI